MADSEAIIGQGTFIRGNVRGDGDLNVAGRVEGTIELRGEVVFEETSLIQSDVTADRIVVRGALAGDLHASDSIVLEAGCKVVGDIDAPRVRIDEGALFRGRIEMGEGASPAPARKAAATTRTPRATSRASSASAPRTTRARAPEPPPEPQQEEEVAPPPPPPPPAPKPRKSRAKSQAKAASDDQPPPPVVPALKKKSKGAVRKRGAR